MSAGSPFASSIVLIARDGMGHGDDALRRKLLRTYLQLLVDSDDVPGAICFYTEGVHLVVDGSPVLDLLAELERKGTHLIVCMTCLNHYDLVGRVKVGIIGGMTDILAAQKAAARVIAI